MYVYAWEQIVSLFHRTDRWMSPKLGRDEVCMVLYIRLGYLARSDQGWIQVGANIGQ